MLRGVEHFLVLRAADVDVAANLHVDPVTLGLRADQVGVAAALHAQRVARSDLAGLVGGAVVVGPALAGCGGKLDGHAVLAAADRKPDADAVAATSMGSSTRPVLAFYPSSLKQGIRL